jgi:alcohol dehydrogenase (nicotinoprotein)
VGATHAVATIEEAADLARSMTNGNGADKAEVSAGIVTDEIVTGAFHVIGKADTLVLTGLNNLLNGKNVRGVLINEH